MFYSLLIEKSQILSYVLIGVLILLLVGSMILMNRRSKKREQEAQALIDAVKPGNKVKTIGGVCGIVVEVNPEEDTFVLETGSETSGKCYMKFVRQAILESDAVIEKEVPAAEPPVAEGDVFEESVQSEEVIPVEQPAEEPVQQVEEAPAAQEEEVAAPAVEEAPVAKKKSTKSKAKTQE